MAYGDALPMLDGSPLPRPNSVDEQPEQVGEDVTLAGGSMRRYDQGERQVFSLGWSKLTEAQLAQLRAAARRGVLSYVHLDGQSYAVLLDGRPSATPVPGTVPVRYAVSLTLREQTPQV